MLRDALPLGACDAVHRRVLTKPHMSRRIVCRRSYFAFTTRLSLILYPCSVLALLWWLVLPALRPFNFEH